VYVRVFPFYFFFLLSFSHSLSVPIFLGGDTLYVTGAPWKLQCMNADCSVFRIAKK
jgi:hypothetical protein